MIGKLMIIGEKVAMVRKLRGWKQEALAYMLRKKGFNSASIEKKEHIEDDLLREIEIILEVSPGYIKDFDREAVMELINMESENILLEIMDKDNDGFIQKYSIPKDYRDNLPFEPLEKIIELYNRLLASEVEKIQILNNQEKLLDDKNCQS